MAVYNTHAIVLRRIPLGETDKIITLMTRDGGKYNAVAKGSRKTTSRLAGATEPLMFLRASLAEGMNLDILTQCEIRESFAALRGDFGLYLRATYSCELLDKTTPERDTVSAPEAFDLLLSTMYVLQRATDPDACVHAYELQLMAQIGYEPQLIECVRCERAFDEAMVHTTVYAPARGGAMCDVCADTAKDETFPLSATARLAMLDLRYEADPRTLAAYALPEGEPRAEIARALRSHLRYRLERDVRSTAFLDAFRLGAMDDIDSLMNPLVPPTKDTP
ncbi:MAG: DNA repair protein RecO [Armatimonadetes bacterium]|nr:DNA repair protein RecO [Armatimonadota bacterium]